MNSPKRFIKQYKLVPDKIGPDRRQEILNNIDVHGTFAPRGVEIEDMDRSFMDSVKTDMEIIIDGRQVPAITLNSQRWAEISKTFNFREDDDFKNLKMPFITIVRNPDIQPGTNQASMFNIPQGNKTYAYVKVPSLTDKRGGVDTYKIPQPTCIDIIYEVRLFCTRMEDLNKLHKKIQILFQSKQHYIDVKGHPMPVTLESISDESTMSDFENRRFYVQRFEMKLMGYLLNEDDFEIIPSINRTMITTELMNNKIKPTCKISQKESDVLFYDFNFKVNSSDRMIINNNHDIIINNISNLKNILAILIFVNNVQVFIGSDIDEPINIKSGNEISVSISRINENLESSFNFSGEIK